MHDAALPILRRLGLIGPGETVVATMLAGGVSSDIVLVTTASGRRFCVKQALPRLKVAALWEAPIARNAAEVDWLRAVARWRPECVPTILAADAQAGFFVMEYLPPDQFPVWKAELLAGGTSPGFAHAVGHALAAIHTSSAAEPGLAAQFGHGLIFEAIRLAPYLRATAQAHPDLASHLNQLADRTRDSRVALMHGDVSPKNILRGPRGPVFLDAECACWGDPAFDLAFCLNHLLLKGAHRPQSRAGYLADFAALWRGYRDGVGWEPPDALEARCATLLPALLLARIDGKSPVEYLDTTQRAKVRAAARAMLPRPTDRLAAIAELWGRDG